MPRCIRSKARRPHLFYQNDWESDITPAERASITPEKLTKFLKDGRSTFGAIEDFVETLGKGHQVNKVAFARAVLAVVGVASSAKLSSSAAGAVESLFANFRALLSQLNDLIRRAEKERSTERVTQKVNRLVRTFFLDHPEAVTREKAGIMLREIEESLDESVESDHIRGVIPSISREFNLGENILKSIENFPIFRERVERIRYLPKLGTQEAGAANTPEYLLPEEAATAEEALDAK